MLLCLNFIHNIAATLLYLSEVSYEVGIRIECLRQNIKCFWKLWNTDTGMLLFSGGSYSFGYGSGSGSSSGSDSSYIFTSCEGSIDGLIILWIINWSRYLLESSRWRYGTLLGRRVYRTLFSLLGRMFYYLKKTFICIASKLYIPLNLWNWERNSLRTLFSEKIIPFLNFRINRKIKSFLDRYWYFQSYLINKITKWYFLSWKIITFPEHSSPILYYGPWIYPLEWL